jgi:hypothetical protein
MDIIRFDCLFIFAFQLTTKSTIVSVYSQNTNLDRNNEISQAFIKNLRTNEKTYFPVKITRNIDNKLAIYELFISSAAVSESQFHWDSSGGIKLTITQYYQEHVVGSYVVALTQSSAKWEKSDYRITINNAYVRSEVYGYPEKGGALLTKSETKTIGILGTDT